MSISRMETQLQRLNAKIGAREAELSDLKSQRKELKARLVADKKAAKAGKVAPAEAESDGLVKRIGTALSETILNPITGLLNPKAERAEA